jgi:hypothetical protein
MPKPGSVTVPKEVGHIYFEGVWSNQPHPHLYQYGGKDLHGCH